MIRSYNWAMSLPVKPAGKKLVLLALADVATETLKTYPSMEFFRQSTGLSPDQITKFVLELETEKVITDTGKRTGPDSMIKVYQLEMTVPFELTAPKVRKAKLTEETAENLQIYEAYPARKRVSKPKTLTAIARGVKLYGYEVVLDGTKRFAEAWKDAPEGDWTYCPNSQTFFNGDRYADSPETWRRGSQKAGVKPALPAVNAPKFSEVLEYFKEKETDNAKAEEWAKRFFARWNTKRWMERGKDIEWKIEASKQAALWKTLDGKVFHFPNVQ